MATGTNLLTTYKARILAHTPNNTTTFLRGDNDWSNTLTGQIVAASFKINNADTLYSNGFIELYHSTPYIDFHYNNDASDFTYRIIAEHDNGIHITSKSNTNCWLYLGNGTNQAGIFWSVFSGGWYMNDNKWIRSYNKPVLIDVNDSLMSSRAIIRLQVSDTNKSKK